MRRFVAVILTSLAGLCATAEEYTLDSIQNMARANYPAIRLFGIAEQIEEFTVANAASAWIPQISLSGTASWQSDVVSFPESMTDIFSALGVDITGLRKDQYKVVLNIEQMLWDGGYTKAQKESAMAEKDVSVQSAEAELYALRDRINQLYFGILVLNEQLRLNDLVTGILEDNCNTVRAYIANGVAKAPDLAKIEAELVSNSQQRTRLQSSRKAYMQVLSIMTGRELDAGDTFVKPEAVLYTEDETVVNRPELRLYDARIASVEAQRAALRSTLMPRFSLFAQGLYGYPGLNMFEDMMQYKWSPNVYVGFRFQWNISSFYTHKNTGRKLDASVQQIGLQRETFLYNTRLQQAQISTDIEQMRDILRDDDRLIQLRSSIREASEAQLRNGIILISDLLRDINDEHKANIDKALHEIEYLKKLYEMKYTLNN